MSNYHWIPVRAKLLFEFYIDWNRSFINHAKPLMVAGNWACSLWRLLLKLSNISLSWNKGNHDHDVVCISDLSLHRFFTILFLCFLLSFSFDWEDISNTQDSVWPHFQAPLNTVFRVWCYISNTREIVSSGYWCFSGWRLAKLASIQSKTHLQHDSLFFVPPASRFATFLLGQAQKSKFWPISLGFSIFFFAVPFSTLLFFWLQWLTFYWACLRLKKKFSRKRHRDGQFLPWSSQLLY